MDTPKTTAWKSMRVEDLEVVDRYKLLTGLVVPRPIGWIGSRSADGQPNLAPFSFFNALGHHPPVVVFSVGVSPRVKDTAANVAETGVFTVNIVTAETVEAMNASAEEFPPDIDEFEAAGLTAVPGTVVDAPMVAEATATLECRLFDSIDLKPDGDEASYRVFFGRVEVFNVAERVLDGTRILRDELQAIGRCRLWLCKHHRRLVRSRTSMNSTVSRR